MLVKTHAKESGVSKQKGSENTSMNQQCVEFQKLKDWQVKQYRHAVDEHRIHMSEEHGRCVGWFEAERDFYENGCDNLAKQWRYEYCGLICPSRNECLLALQFMKQREEVLLHRAG
jgi:hypothetical protein